MTTMTNTEIIESLERTIAATTENIVRKEAELAELKSVNYANQRELQDRRHAVAVYNTTENRFKRAVVAARKSGVHMRTNIVECCRGCVTSEKLNLKDETQPYGWTYGGQGRYLRWNIFGDAVYEDRGSKPYGSVFYNWGNGSAEAIKAAFEAEGFQVNWDGSEFASVEIVL